MKKILVIDDHPAVMEGTKSILESDQAAISRLFKS